MTISEILKKHSKNGNNKVFVYLFETPVGGLIAGADNEYLYFVIMEDSKNVEKTLQSVSKQLSCDYIEEKNKILNQFGDELKQYFEGKLSNFTVSIKTFGSEFQKAVWGKLLEIPFGTTYTYATIAENMGRPASHSRAVGAACGANAHLIVIPCHRVVASGSTGGFSCGTNRKEWLLQHEKKFT